MARRPFRRPVMSWRSKACLLLALFIGAQIAIIAIAVPDRVPPTVTAKDASIEYGETLAVDPFVRINDDRTEAAIAALSVEPSEGIEVADDFSTISFPKAGTYKATVYAKDEDGNIGTGEFTVTMKPEPRPVVEGEGEAVESGGIQPGTTPFPVPENTVIPGQTGRWDGTFVVGQDVSAGLYKLIGLGEKRGRADAGSIRITKHMLQDADVDIAILDALALSGEFYGSKWVYLSEGTEFTLDGSTALVAESAVPETLYTQVHLDGMYCAGIDIEPGKYLIRANRSSERDSGTWSIADLFDLVVFTYVQDVKVGEVKYSDDEASGDEVWVYRGQYLKLENCTAMKVS